MGMRLTLEQHRHSHLLSDLDPTLPLLAFAGVMLSVTTLAVYLYAATM